MLPVPLILLSYCVLLSPELWRRGLLLTIVCVVAGKSLADVFRARRRRLSLPVFTAGFDIGLFVLPLIIAATGAIESAAVPALLALALLIGLFDRGRMDVLRLLWLIAMTQVAQTSCTTNQLYGVLGADLSIGSW